MKFTEELLDTLTRREREAYDLLILGYSLKEIAVRLKIKWSSAGNLCSHVYRRLNVTGQADVILGHYGLPSWMDEKKGIENGRRHTEGA